MSNTERPAAPPAPDIPAAAAPTELHARALARLADGEPGTRPGTRPDTAPTPSHEDGQKALHELRVHQIELEMQNEELRRTQHELEASRQRWFELYDLAPVGYCTVSDGGLIVRVNLAAAEFLGLPRAALAQRRFAEFIEASDQASYYAMRSQLAHSFDRLTCELRMLGAQGVPRWVQLTATAVAGDGPDPRSLRIVLQDISARRQAEAAEAALRLAEASSRSRNEFLSRVSHEFRTPLNAIMGFSRLLIQDPGLALPPKARAQLQHIHDAGTHLVHMVTDLLDVSSAASGQLALQIDDVDAFEALGDAIAHVGAHAQAAGVHIELASPPPADAWVRADPTRLRQVLQNLLTNAVKYNRGGGRVAASVSRLGEHWCVRIADNGLGMTPEQQASLFQPFNRLGREAAGIEGTGLGLVIVRDLVHGMGGRLRVRSEPGQGSEFFVELQAAVLAPRLSSAPAPAARPGTAGRVLLVEDDAASAALVGSILEQRPGVELEVVATGAACMAAARRAWPSLLLLDLRLPDMPGLDVLKVLRQLNPHLPLRCLVISAEAASADGTQALADGVDEHLAKPIEPAKLLSLVDRLLAQPTPAGHRQPDRGNASN